MKRKAPAHEQYLRERAHQLAISQQAQIWLLASPVEADQLVQGQVPPEICEQAKRGLAFVRGE